MFVCPVVSYTCMCLTLVIQQKVEQSGQIKFNLYTLCNWKVKSFFLFDFHPNKKETFGKSQDKPQILKGSCVGIY